MCEFAFNPSSGNNNGFKSHMDSWFTVVGCRASMLHKMIEHNSSFQMNFTFIYVTKSQIVKLLQPKYAQISQMVKFLHSK